MCQSDVYLLKNGKEEELMRDVILVEPCPEGVRIQGFFEPPRVINAKISRIDLLKHKVILTSDE
ncbi:MAG: CooT family nickel-binding protein [Desulfobacteraceae bacterium]|nr:CooT family nickel-binding protein [Desulfobacteraceae bacterium]